MTNRFAIGVIVAGLAISFILALFKLQTDSNRVSWLLVLAPFLLAWFRITYGYVWLLYELR